MFSIEWAIPYHVVESTTFVAPTGDLVTLVGRMIIATMFHKHLALEDFDLVFASCSTGISDFAIDASSESLG